MGQQGNWKKEGYRIKQTVSYEDVKDSNDWEILMISPDKEKAGSLRVYVDRQSNYLIASNVEVKEDHQRKGIATALYDFAENLTGKKFKPANEVSDDPDDFSDDAELFWKSRY